TGQADMVVGTLYNGRNYEELHNALGLFARHLPLSCSLEDTLTMRELLSQLNESAHSAETWQECFTWEDFADVPRVGEAPPFFPFCFAYAPPPMSAAAGEVTFTVEQADACIDRFQVCLTCAPGPDGLRATVHYNAQCYRPEDMTRLAQQWLTVVRSIVRTPEVPLRTLEVLSATERAYLLEAGSGPRRALETDTLLHHLVETQAARQPDAIALVVEDEYLSYGALNRRANRLAHYLQKLGVGPEARVGLSVARSPELLVGLLGILKAGGAYVPLEPELPAERMAYMVTAAQPRVLLTHEQWRARLPVLGTQVVCLDSAWAEIEQESMANAHSGVQAENLVYALFTSGSTGRPKGVAVEHRQLRNYLASIAERLGLEAGARYAAVTTLAADLGHTVVFPALATGGCLHVVRLERAADPAALAAYLGREAIDCVKMVPSHLAALLAADPGAAEMPRQRMVLGGEACAWEIVQRVQALAPACMVFNHYGPTETTVGVLTYQVEPETAPEGTATVPLGRPLSNTQVYVLDAYLQPVPTWVPGEVYIGGAQVGRGYLQQPELTAERFVPDPFSTVPGARVYRTGDVARWLPDGTLEFVGRIDHQVKLRGFRVELGEIEAVLRQHPAVQASVVVVRQAGSEAQRVVAYVVGRAGVVPAAELRRFMQERVPDYMVPAAFVPLAALPLTPNGKVDRAALLALEEPRGAVGASPRTPLEELVAGLWAEVLGLAQVGVHDDFFALGGHSLLVTRVAARVSEVLKVELPFRTLFEKRTVAELVESIELARRGEQRLQTPPILPVSRHGELPLSFAQQRLWFFDQLEPYSPAYNIPGAVRLSGGLNIVALEQTLTEITRRHEVLRTTFPTVEGQPRQVIAPAMPVCIPVIDLRELSQSEGEAAARWLTMQAARRPLTLDRGPLLRVGLLRLDEQEHILLFTMHHIVSDAWSMGVLVREVAALYAAFSTGKPSPLPELRLQYADFASWQRQWLQGEVLESHVSYWKQQLDGAPKVLELPTDRPRPAVQTWRGARQSLVLSDNLTVALKALSRREGVTLFMTLLAAFKTLMHHYTAQADMVVGTNTANRSHAQTADLIGFFVNQLVLRTDLSGNPRFRELLGRVRDMALGAYAHQDLPFEKLVEDLQPQRDMSRSLLFQIKFELQDGTARVLELPGLTLTPLEIDHTVVRHD
ncbi:MAG TPA: amino acid adenylation domain-containing protein, partial [Candidatus Tectomicrobia bacterium]